MPKKNALTARQVRFCHEYLLSGNIGSAAVQAGYSLQSSYDIGKRLLKTPKVKAYLDELCSEQREKYKGSAERVIEELCMVAFSDFGDYVSWGNTCAELKLIPEFKRRAVSEVIIVSTAEGTKTRLKMHDKLQALQLLGRHFNILDKPKITTSATQTISIHAPNLSIQKAEALADKPVAPGKMPEVLLPAAEFCRYKPGSENGDAIDGIGKTGTDSIENEPVGE